MLGSAQLFGGSAICPRGVVPVIGYGRRCSRAQTLTRYVSRARSNVIAMSKTERIRFQTETGSVYELVRTEAGEMSWARLSATLASGDLRNAGGRLLHWPEVVIGARCDLIGEPLNPPFPRAVRTSFVVAIIDADGRVLPTGGAGARRTFRYLQVGDKVTRVAAGTPMGIFTVSAVDEGLIRCGPWTFDRLTGIEVDPELGWGPGGLVGTWLIHPNDEDDA